MMTGSFFGDGYGVFVDCVGRFFSYEGLMAYLLIMWVVFFCSGRIFLAARFFFFRILLFFWGGRILGMVYFATIYFSIFVIVL